MSGYVNENESSEEFNVDITRVVHSFSKILKRQWFLLLIAAALGGAIGGFISTSRYEPYYQSSATYSIYLGDTAVLNYNASTQLSATFPYILQAGELTARIREDLGVSSIPGSVTATAIEGANLLTIYAYSSSPEWAYKILESTVKVYPELLEYVVGPTELTLIIPPQLPTEPYNDPHVARSVMVGVAAGCALVLIYMAVVAIFTNTILHTTELRELLNQAPATAVPSIKNSGRDDGFLLIKDSSVNRRFYESISQLRNLVTHKAKRDNIKSILITSTMPGEGKTTISTNLALSLAHHSYKVLLIDLDLRNPSVFEHLGLECVTPFSDVIRGKAKFADAVIMENQYLTVVGDRDYNADAPELIQSPTLGKFIAAAAEKYDFVIIDTAPCNLAVDAITVADSVDGMIYVVKQDYVITNAIKDTLGRFREGRARIVAGVLNEAKSKI